MNETLNRIQNADSCVGQAMAPRDDCERQRSPTIRTSIDVPAHHSFGTAIRALKDGQRATRVGWNGRGMHIELQVPDKGSKMSRPYIFMKTVDGDLVPWVASQSDILADDWAVLPR